MRKAREEGFPSAVEDKEAYFMNEVGKGEILCQDGMYSPIFSPKGFSPPHNSAPPSYANTTNKVLNLKKKKLGSDQVEAALCFYKALKVYPQPRDLIQIYDKTVPKPIIDILAEMIAADSTIDVGPFGALRSSPGGSDSGSLHGGIDI